MYLKEVEGETAGSHTFRPLGLDLMDMVCLLYWCHAGVTAGALSWLTAFHFEAPYSAISRIPGILASAPPVCQLPSRSSLSQCLSPPLAWVRLWVFLSRGLWPPRLCLEKCDKASLCHHILAAPHFPTLSTVDGSGKLCLHSCLSSSLPLGLTLPSIT